MTESAAHAGEPDGGSLDALLQPGGIAPDDPLFDFEASAEAERLARLAADQDLVSTLQWCDFDPTTPEWRKLAKALVEYGYSIFKGWLIKGEACQRARDRGVRGLSRLPETLRLGRDDAHALSADLMIVSVEAFRVRVLLRGVWNWRGGASLKTFFIGQCLFQLPDMYTRWRQQEIMGAPVALQDRTRRQILEGELDPAKTVNDQPAADSILARIRDPIARQMFDLLARDLPYSATAEALNTTEGAVRTRLSRARKQLQEASG